MQGAGCRVQGVQEDPAWSGACVYCYRLALSAPTTVDLAFSPHFPAYGVPVKTLILILLRDICRMLLQYSHCEKIGVSPQHPRMQGSGSKQQAPTARHVIPAVGVNPRTSSVVILPLCTSLSRIITCLCAYTAVTPPP